MKRRLEHIAAVAGLLLGAVCGVHAQASDTIVANPKAVLLHRIWMVRGGTTGQDRVGEGAGGIGDIDGDSISEFAVRFGKAAQWRVYKGARPAPSTTPMWTLDSAAAAPAYPVVGDFWGTGHKAIGFGIYHPSVQFDQRFFLAIYRTETGAIADTPALIMDPDRTMTPSVIPGIHDMYAADLDGDGADELIAVVYRLFRGNVESSNGEIWVFKGGPNFQVDTPTVIIRDPEANTNDKFFAAIGDLDGDHHPDILTGGGYQAGAALKFWWGDGGPVANWNGRAPDRTIEMTDQYPSVGINLLDCDGDGVSDLLLGSPGGPRLYRSRAGKNIRTRSLLNSDADHQFQANTFRINGYGSTRAINDNAAKYDMTLLYGPSPSGQGSIMLTFSGGENGPDNTYESYYSAEFDGLIEGNVFQFDGPAGDCDGDGWNDLLVACPSWYGFDQGIAIVLAGGPYIPRDSSTSGVDDVAIAGVRNALSIWPTPAGDELHIAWRGDLHRVPSRFAVFDILGNRIAEGNVDSWRGEAVWNCSDVPPGVYILSVHDSHGILLATTRIIKQ
ncbi:MAG: T9SS type A sorting domain-containing protein [Bacteroidetes bacterium]|nr:T9SS type A sorting domain-containing protein [Bacteroidota bacterium]